MEALGGKRGLVDTGLPTIVFVLINSVGQAVLERDAALRAALVGALLCGVVIVGLRLWQRQTLQQAISGFLGLAIAVWFAARSGEARDFYLPGILWSVAYGLAFLGSVLIRRPLVGVIYAAVDGLDARWRDDDRLRRTFAIATLFWSALYLSKVGVQGGLYLADRPGLLAAARLLMGFPLTIAGVALTVAYVRRARSRAPVPPGPPVPATP